MDIATVRDDDAQPLWTQAVCAAVPLRHDCTVVGAELFAATECVKAVASLLRFGKISFDEHFTVLNPLSA